MNARKIVSVGLVLLGLRQPVTAAERCCRPADAGVAVSCCSREAATPAGTVVAATAEEAAETARGAPRFTVRGGPGWTAGGALSLLAAGVLSTGSWLTLEIARALALAVTR